MASDSSRLGFWKRRFVTTWLYARPACRSLRCGREVVGFSVWCRGHTDAILFHGEDPSADRVTPRYESMTDEERHERWLAKYPRRSA